MSQFWQLWGGFLQRFFFGWNHHLIWSVLFFFCHSHMNKFTSETSSSSSGCGNKVSSSIRNSSSSRVSSSSNGFNVGSSSSSVNVVGSVFFFVFFFTFFFVFFFFFFGFFVTWNHFTPSGSDSTYTVARKTKLTFEKKKKWKAIKIKQEIITSMFLVVCVGVFQFYCCF